MDLSMTFPPRAIRPLRALAAVLLSAGLLAACGGSTSQVDAFAPARLLAFGDELSYLTDDGHKYSLNALNTTDKTLDCTLSPLWVQTLATHYGKVFSQCKGTGTNVTALREATVGARVDDVVTKVNGLLAGGGLNSDDLVTVLVGMHDVLDVYAQYDGNNEADLTATLTSRGETLAALINKIVGTGARVLVSTAPDMGLTPFALAEKTNVGDDRPALLTRLTDALNKNMRLNLINDGSKLGLLIGDDLVRGMVAVPTAYGLTDAVRAVCTTALPNCTPNTVITDAATTSSAFLWADTLRPSAIFQLQLGNQAVSRVTTLPF